MISQNDVYGELEIAGTISKSVKAFNPLILTQREEANAMDAKSGEDFHLGNIGRLIEANETEIRTEMDGIYINKTKQIMNTGRLKEEYMTRDEKLNFQQELAQAQAKMKLSQATVL